MLISRPLKTTPNKPKPPISDFGLSRNLLKGQVGDEINVLMAACAWNLKKWLVIATIFLFWQKLGLFFVKYLQIPSTGSH
jgi:hypothetical protein